jgi:hypothetical protein
MRKTIYNPQKGRLETIEVTFTDKNTTWFDDPDGNTDVAMIADVEGGLLIAENNYNYPVLIYDVARSDISHDRQKAAALNRMYSS